MVAENQALDSEYVIDGVKMEMTPRQMLEQCMADSSEGHSGVVSCDRGKSEPIVDESLDPNPTAGQFDINKIPEYQGIVRNHHSGGRKMILYSPADVTRFEIEMALLSMIWSEGHFRLDDLAVSLRWLWNQNPTGGMASFYQSVEEVCTYLDSLGIRISSYEYVQTDADSVLEISACLEPSCPDVEQDEDVFINMPYRARAPFVGEGRRCDSICSGNPDNWLIYIPFDSCKFRLGGSLLEEVTGISGGRMPDVGDFDYFIDCYEVVREFVEDGIIVSAAAVGIGGLASALECLAGSGLPAETGSGADIDIAEVMRSYQEDNPVKVLFGEVPGVLIEIRSSEFDYVDAELLLQDVAYYPLGHPGKNGLRISWNRNSGLADILQSLISSQTAEGED